MLTSSPSLGKSKAGKLVANWSNGDIGLEKDVRMTCVYGWPFDLASLITTIGIVIDRSYPWNNHKMVWCALFTPFRIVGENDLSLISKGNLITQTSWWIWHLAPRKNWEKSNLRINRQSDIFRLSAAEGTLLCSMKLSIIDALQRDKMLDEAAALTGNRTLCSMSRVEAWRNQPDTTTSGVSVFCDHRGFSKISEPWLKWIELEDPGNVKVFCRWWSLFWNSKKCYSASNLFKENRDKHFSRHIKVF